MSLVSATDNEQENNLISVEKNNERWSIFLEAGIENGVCHAMSYLIKEDDKYYVQDFRSTYDGHFWGPDSMSTKYEVFEDDALEIACRVIKADRQGTLPELVRQESLLVFDFPYRDFGVIETLRIPAVLMCRLKTLNHHLKKQERCILEHHKTAAPAPETDNHSDSGAHISSLMDTSNTTGERHQASSIPDELEQLIEIVQRENLSMLICYQENGAKGFIFDHLHDADKTILRKTGEYWEIYYTTGSNVYNGVLKDIPTQREAVRKALLHAWELKLQNKSDPKINHGLLHWTLDGWGTLTLSGHGPMPSVLVPQHGIDRWIGTIWDDPDDLEFEEIEDTIPWDVEKVQKVVIEAGLTTVSSKAFDSVVLQCVNGYFVNSGYEVLREIILPDTVETLEKYSIVCRTALEKAVIPASVVNIHEGNFAGSNYCPNLVFYTPKDTYAASFAKARGIRISAGPNEVTAEKASQESSP